MKTRGMALVITMLFMLILTLLGLSLLLLAGSYYSSVHNLFEDTNARVACGSATQNMIDRHNLADTTPRFFFDPQQWSQQSMLPFNWSGYTITARLMAAWSNNAGNLVQVSARKRSFLSEQQMEIRQRRPENFALFTDDGLNLNVASLFDGLVFSRKSIELLKPGVRFREVVTADINPASNASFKKINLQKLDYPGVDQWISLDNLFDTAANSGIVVLNKDPIFWEDDHYRLNLDEFQISLQGQNWSIRYKDVDYGVRQMLVIWFDDSVHISQSSQPIPFLPSTKVRFPIYVCSASNIALGSNLKSVESVDGIHPICLISARSVRISSQVPRACRIQACLVEMGSPLEVGEDGLVIDPGGQDLTPSEKNDFLLEIRTSSFLLEEQHKNALVQALENGEKIVWFRGTVILRAPMKAPTDVKQLHFEASREIYPIIPSFPFVYLVEGTRKWR